MKDKFCKSKIYSVGYVGEGEYKTKENGKHTKCYNTWYHMLRRCYDKKFQEKNPTYVSCEVDKEWHNFQNFAEWYYDNYYEIEGERMHLDKDILVKHNKIYSPETCVFVPERINKLFVKKDKNRGDLPIGVTLYKKSNKFKADCNTYDFLNKKSVKEYLGLYNTKEDAFESYKEFKEKYIKEVADYYKNLIPNKLYNALYNYEIEITD